jgi:hypothetical protein
MSPRGIVALGGLVITDIELSRIRGIREGRVTGLTPLSVFVGRNGCGKSTVLDALAIAAASEPVNALKDALLRRGADDLHLRPEWFLFDRNLEPEGTILLSGLEGRRNLRFSGVEGGLRVFEYPPGARQPSQIGSLTGDRSNPGTESSPPSRRPPQPNEMRFLDQRTGERRRRSATQLYSDARLTGRKKQVMDMLQALVPRAEDIEILTLNDVPTLHLSFPGSAVPLSLAGDGVRNAVLLSLELGAPDGSLLLVEEPETHLHFGAMRLVASALARAVAPKGTPVNQVVLATHSLEFIDALVSVCSELGLQQLLSVHRLALNDGVLSTSSFSGDLVANARLEAELELR